MHENIFFIFLDDAAHQYFLLEILIYLSMFSQTILFTEIDPYEGDLEQVAGVDVYFYDGHLDYPDCDRSYFFLLS